MTIRCTVIETVEGDHLTLHGRIANGCRDGHVVGEPDGRDDSG